ncbi:MAG: fibronectin type III domain-containing protein [Desulfobacterales bacterium]|jgi:fibronectin type 3 domain-containing protein
MNDRKYNLAINAYFYFLWFLLAIISLSACSENIPPASDLVSGEVTLSWIEVPDAISYNVYGSTSPGVTKFSGFKFRNTPNPFTITQLQPDKTYYFVVTVITDSGESEESKELSYTAVMNKVGFIDFKNIIDKPIKDQKSKTSEKGIVTLAWDNVPNATSYNIYWKDSPGVTKLNGKKISNVKNPHTIKGLNPGTYYFVVTAVNDLGESAESEEFSISVD